MFIVKTVAMSVFHFHRLFCHLEESCTATLERKMYSSVTIES